MAVEQWNNFTYYNVGDEVQNGSSTKYACILRNINQPPPNLTYWNELNPPSGNGIASLQGLTSGDNGGNLVLASPTATFTTNPPNGTINMNITYPRPENLIQFGYATQVAPPAFQPPGILITLPIPYATANYGISLQLNTSPAPRSPVAQSIVTSQTATNFYVLWLFGANPIDFQWITVGATP